MRSTVKKAHGASERYSDGMRGGELIREARTRAGLNQFELAERTGRDRSVIARWEQGLISPPIDSLLACVQACGYDIPLVLVPLDNSADRELRDGLMATPSERVARMLEQLGQERAENRRRGDDRAR
jgi:transcriptional regulator with XRE-family HTH domain